MNNITGWSGWLHVQAGLQNIHAGLAGTGEYLMQGVLVVGDIARDVCTVKGFERFTKAVDSDIKLLAWINPTIGLLFEPIRKQQSDFKTHLYGIMSFGSTAATFIKKNKETGKYELVLPRYEKDTSWGAKKGEIDRATLLGGLGNLVETGKYSQDTYYPFSLISTISSYLGKQKVFDYSIKDLPFGYSLCERPRDILVFAGSCVSAGQWVYDNNRWSVENFLKISGSLAKIALIPCAAIMEKRKYVFTLRILDFVASNSSWLGGVVKSAIEREKEIPLLRTR